MAVNMNNLDYLLEPLLEMEEYKSILEQLNRINLDAPFNIAGPSDSQKAHLAYAICRHLNRKGIFITFNEMQARRFYEDFSFFLGDKVVMFPTKETLYYDVEAKSNDAVYKRITALARIIEGDYSIIVTSVDAVSNKLVPEKLFSSYILNIENGSQLDIQHLINNLVPMGYERADIVEGKGQFAVRGGIIDIFTVDQEDPLRIELFGDEIDSIRTFDVLSQRSIAKLDKVKILPAREIICPVSRREGIIKQIKRDLGSYVNTLKGKKGTDFIKQVRTSIEYDIERFENSFYFPGIDRYTSYIVDQPCHLADYVKDNPGGHPGDILGSYHGSCYGDHSDGNLIVFMDEPVRLSQRMDNLMLENHEVCKNLLEKGRILPQNTDILYDYENILRGLKTKQKVYLSAILHDGQQDFRQDSPRDFSQDLQHNILCKQNPSYYGFSELLVNDINSMKNNGSRIIILAGTKTRGEKLRDNLVSDGIEAVYNDAINDSLQPGKVTITHGSLNKGFQYPSIGFVVISEREVFGQDRRSRKTPKKKAKGAQINLFTDLNPGDYIVHQTHGIGQYVGIEKLVVENIHKDYLKIRYQEGDFLYIPTNQLDTVQKYIGAEGKAPKLSKLGGNDWTKTKKRVKESLKELAEDLVKLYAERKAIKGYSYSKDTVWQNEFEELFPYEETEDQLKCIEEIKNDMQSGKPMDRLLCGDVGYGKTEVALRAVFKAIMDGKQVAFLVPTTVLAQQHYSNFIERMKKFPVTVEMISRFRTRADQGKILKDLKKGHVDVLIGTHRLIQKDIQFKDLGLLVIDEEQRFGVMHKESLKNARPDVDVLTLTATPIPRTLHMSLIGVRDISVIEEPPEERYPVQTYVMEYNDDVIKDAITRELARNGQVFYLYNRVRTIDIKAFQIQELVPEARVGVAHGQMEERKLEDVMLKFINGEFDVLVCTTIIESGLDMPNVNTIIVEDADRMGLAQLYQLRGRVGRSNRLAYAYITYKKDKVLTEIAEKRLQTIKEFTEFGSGFKIAMRDLELRGAGNLLGPEQHGHIESVGYDMYCRLLDEAIRELKGELPVEREIEVTIDLNVNAYIDDEYINRELQKIEMYKKIASIRDEQDVIDIRDELLDRYGDLPAPVENLVDIAYIKALSGELGITSITEKDGAVILQLRNDKSISFEIIGKLAAKYKRQILFNAGNNPYLAYKMAENSREKFLENIKILLHEIKSFEVS
ncbi:MAG TPA: transcription-repair coupling factor [Clostridiales bacterium]|nr:transcription-repair coupling factor [Clostridiales bacterium]